MAPKYCGELLVRSRGSPGTPPALMRRTITSDCPLLSRSSDQATQTAPSSAVSTIGPRFGDDSEAGLTSSGVGSQPAAAAPPGVTASRATTARRVRFTARRYSPGRLRARSDKPSAGLEPATPSLPWKCSTN